MTSNVSQNAIPGMKNIPGGIGMGGFITHYGGAGFFNNNAN
jgi:hypothetical protein